MYKRPDSYIDASIYPRECQVSVCGLANRRWYTVSGIAMSVTIPYWARLNGERGGGGGDSSDNIQIDSYHMAATGTASSSSSSNRRKASGDDQQRRATSEATAGNSVLNRINEQPRVGGGIMIGRGVVVL